MCLQVSAVRPYQKWNWHGDEIIPDPIIPAARLVPQTKIKKYPIDIREYLSMKGNAVMRHTLEALIASMNQNQRELFSSRKPGSFDFRLLKISEFMGTLRYIPSDRTFDQWLYPDETLAQGGGDCEDLSFLFAALLEESGISKDCIRVALGTLVDHSDSDRARSWDHAWVVYQRERGSWQITEPLAHADAQKKGRGEALKRGKRKKSLWPASAPQLDMEYIPHFVFNRDHLWRVRTSLAPAKRDFNKYLLDRKFWEGFNPSFAKSVHEDIFDEALQGMAHADLQNVKSVSFHVDTNIFDYDPRDHFDFAYIDDAWRRIQARLNTGNLEDFALAAHAIADFYAHSLYGLFAFRGDSIPLYDPKHPLPADQLRYDFRTFDLPGCEKNRTESEAYWNGKLISGQWWRWYTTYPDDIQNDRELKPRRCLPDHDEVAVDGLECKPQHRLFKTDEEYRRQFVMRRAAAVAHVKQVYQAWKKKG